MSQVTEREQFEQLQSDSFWHLVLILSKEIDNVKISRAACQTLGCGSQWLPTQLHCWIHVASLLLGFNFRVFAPFTQQPRSTPKSTLKLIGFVGAI